MTPWLRMSAVLMTMLLPLGCGGRSRSTSSEEARTMATAGSDASDEGGAELDEAAADDAGGSMPEGAPPHGERSPAEAAPTTSGAEPTIVDPRLSAHVAELEGIAAQLDASLGLASGLDCDEVTDLKDRICELADRICEIAERHPSSSNARERCEDGRTRCESASEAVDERC